MEFGSDSPLSVSSRWSQFSAYKNTMNHSYFASLLENYRRRMEMDKSLLSIRKALHESYQNESFKLKERERQNMARQRREQMETERILTNRMKEIEVEEKELSKQYEYLRNIRAKTRRKTVSFPAEWSTKDTPTKNRQTADHGVFLPQVISLTDRSHDSTSSGTEHSKPATDIKEIRKISVRLPTLASRRNTEENTMSHHREKNVAQYSVWNKSSNAERYRGERQDFKREDQFPRLSTEHGKESNQVADCFRRQPSLTSSRRMDTNRDLNHGDTRKTSLSPNTPFNSEFTDELINYYMNGGGLSNDEEIPETGKKASMSSCTLKFGKQSKNTGKRGPFNIHCYQDYDILVKDHGEDHNV